MRAASGSRPAAGASARLGEAVASFNRLVAALPQSDLEPQPWGPREVLAHLVGWHETYARTLGAVAAGREPLLPEGTFAEINEAAIRGRARQSVADLCDKFSKTQAEIERSASERRLQKALIQVKRGSKARTLDGFLLRAEAHIRNHAAELQGSLRPASSVRANIPRPSWKSAVQALLESDEASARLWVLEGVLDYGPASEAVIEAKEAVRRSSRVRLLLSERRPDGTIPYHPYTAKWYGAHWVLVALAELGYPAGDRSLQPLLDQDLDWLHSADYLRRLGTVRGLPRMHASIDANAVWTALRLGLDDPRLAPLVDRLIDAQWPDGGWNCDRAASGRSSSFTESLGPLRALALHARDTGDQRAAAAAGSEADFFLRHRLYRRQRDGAIIHPAFVQLHYPCYWHYDVLFGLEVMAEAGFIRDERCSEALDLLESKRLPDGGFPAEHRYYRPARAMVPSQRSLVDWGRTGRRLNPFVTARAMAVLHAAGRLRDD